MNFRVGNKYQRLFGDSICACCDPRLGDFTRRMNVDISRRGFLIGASVAGLAFSGVAKTAHAQTSQPKGVLFENVRIFDGKADKLSAPSNVLVVGNIIKTISTAAIAAPPDIALTRIPGGGRTLTPGLIDAHTHIMFATVPQLAVLTTDISFVTVAAVKQARDALMRGFTSIRDMGGPSFGLKRGIDAGLAPEPRIWPSSAFISQTGGHGDFRLPNDLPARPGDYTYSEKVGGAAIADDTETVRKHSRELLTLGASQLKLRPVVGFPWCSTRWTLPNLPYRKYAPPWKRPITLMELRHHSLLPRKSRHQFDMRRVAELVDRRDTADLVAAVDQAPRIAGKRRDIAGHRDHDRDLAGGKLFHLCLRALPWRIEHDGIVVAQFLRHQRAVE